MAYLYLLNDATPGRPDIVLRQGVPTTFSEWEAKPLTPLVAIGAFCLMPNHFHIYATPLVEDGISKFMQRVQTAYTMYFNEKHDRSGALLQGTFKARHVTNEQYAKYLFSYIHLNPAKLRDPLWKERSAREYASLREFIRTYPYSSLAEYLSSEHEISNPTAFPEYFTHTTDLDAHINFWLSTKDAVGG